MANSQGEVILTAVGVDIRREWWSRSWKIRNRYGTGGGRYEVWNSTLTIGCGDGDALGGAVSGALGVCSLWALVAGASGRCRRVRSGGVTRRIALDGGSKAGWIALRVVRSWTSHRGG